MGEIAPLPRGPIRPTQSDGLERVDVASSRRAKRSGYAHVQNQTDVLPSSRQLREGKRPMALAHSPPSHHSSVDRLALLERSTVHHEHDTGGARAWANTVGWRSMAFDPVESASVKETGWRTMHVDSSAGAKAAAWRPDEPFQAASAQTSRTREWIASLPSIVRTHARDLERFLRCLHRSTHARTHSRMQHSRTHAARTHARTHACSTRTAEWVECDDRCGLILVCATLARRGAAADYSNRRAACG